MKNTRGEMAHTASAIPAHAGYRQSLLEKRIELMAAMVVKFDTMATLGRVAEEDLAQLSHDEFINLRLNKIDYDILKLVNEALDRLDTGDYGTCHRCEEEIAIRRLQVVPWAKYCVRCQEKISLRLPDEEEALVSSVW